MKRFLISLLLVSSGTTWAQSMTCTVQCFRMRSDDRSIILKKDRLPQLMKVRIPFHKKEAFVHEILLDRCFQDYGGNRIVPASVETEKVEDPQARVYVNKFKTDAKFSVKQDCKEEAVTKVQEKDDSLIKDQDRIGKPYQSAEGSTAPEG